MFLRNVGSHLEVTTLVFIYGYHDGYNVEYHHPTYVPAYVFRVIRDVQLLLE
jgi:hypothetical protein